ncbi:outer membrane beta-barrel protein [Chryseolinea soli]|uniref:Uncharacterized protein n=1 Tax=Chryseolinea soli TaxID=2321403 RepID=A0A385SR81_9BACT|nr:outer membrane beta-barrel protein [Chryseolinea soli]AYB32465.1 hypothetical protein D4L85_18635 [Chryseolinea soli]
MKLFFALVLSFISLGLYAQDFKKGFIVTLENDTVPGLLSYREGSKAHRVCSFKASPEQEVVKYEPTQLVGYGFVNDTYFSSKFAETKDSTSQQVFLELLVKGRVSLYKYDYFFFMEKEGDDHLHKIIRRDMAFERNGLVYKQKSTTYIGVVKTLLNDCQELKGEMENIGFNEQSLARLVEKYNRCMGASLAVPKAQKRWFKGGIGLVAGVVQSRLHMTSEFGWNEYLAGTYPVSTAPVVGATFSMSSPRINERLAVLVEARFLKSSYVLHKETVSVVTTQRGNSSIDISQLHIPVGIRYTFTSQKVAPFFDVGFSTGFFLNKKATTQRELQYPNTSPQVFPEEDLPLKSRQSGLWGGIGMVFSIHPHWNSFVELRYEKAGAIVDPDVRDKDRIGSHVNSLQLTIGLRTK